MEFAKNLAIALPSFGMLLLAGMMVLGVCK